MPTRFTFAETYSRAQVAERIGMPKERQGGNWMTGYDEWNDEYFVFCNIGIAGRSGHDYANRWDSKELIWFAKGGARRGTDTLSRLIREFWSDADFRLEKAAILSLCQAHIFSLEIINPI